MTRYYGLYARHRDIDIKLHRAVHKSKHGLIRSFTKWRKDILLSFGYDPLSCSHCKKEMTDSDLLDMHYFLIEDDDLDDDEFEEGFYIDLF